LPPKFSEIESDALTGDEPTLTSGSLADHVARCATAVDSLVAQAWALRLLPVEPMLGELAEHAVEVALAQRKKVKVVIEGADLKLERRLLDQLWEPLVHLVRNAIDHGIEPVDQRGDKPAEALLSIRVESTGEHIVITVSDDGRGIQAETVRAAAVRGGLLDAADAETLDDAETLKLVFHHGFTTRAEVGDWSGRGVGLDVVRAVADELGGSVGVETDPGYGTTFSLYLPALLTKDRVVVFEFGGQLFAVPSRQVQRFTRLDPDEAGLDTLRTESDTESIPLVSWNKFLGKVPAPADEWAIVLEAEGLTWALALEGPPFETELLLRPSPAVARVPPRSSKAAPPSSGSQSTAPWEPPISAQGTLEDGRVVYLLGVADLAARCRQLLPKAP
jgi:two-component system chemotaxis sensor kinase CheA